MAKEATLHIVFPPCYVQIAGYLMLEETKMVKKSFALLTAVCPLLIVSACNQEPMPRKISAPEVATPASPAAPAAPVAESAAATGEVIETMSTAGYTYVHVDTGSEQIWAAAPESRVKVGDQVRIPSGAPMRNYHSKTLDRDFEVVYFVNMIQNADGESLAVGHGTPAGHPAMPGHSSKGGKSPPAEIDVSGVEEAEGGKTIAEIYAEKSDLADKQVTVRGKVVKFNAQIMRRNWLHVQDGTGDAAEGTNDLTVTTDVAAKVGDTVLVTGEVHLDVDFTHGYKYDVIIEDAKVVVE
jgi:hypothetical protein